VSEAEAKQYLLDGIENCRKALSELDSTDKPGLADRKKTIEETVQLLEGLKEKVFFKTKKALSPAYQVLEASQNVADRAEELSDADEDALKEFAEAVGQLKDRASALEAASKTQSVIVT